LISDQAGILFSRKIYPAVLSAKSVTLSKIHTLHIISEKN